MNIKQNEKVFERIKTVLEDPELKNLDKLVFCALITFNGRGKMFPSRNKIAERLRMKRVGSISKSVSALSKKHIDVFKEQGKSNKYRFKQSLFSIEENSETKVLYDKSGIPFIKHKRKPKLK